MTVDAGIIFDYVCGCSTLCALLQIQNAGHVLIGPFSLQSIDTSHTQRHRICVFDKMASLAAKKKGTIKLDASSALNKTSTLEGIGHHDKGDKISDGGSTKLSHPERSMLAKTTTIAAPPSQSEPRMMYGQVM